MSNEIRVSVASDYAVLQAGSYGEFYYGYEESVWPSEKAEREGKGEEWCFVYRIPASGIKNQIPFSQLGGKDMWDTTENLLLGIGHFLASGKGVARIPTK